MHSIYSNWEGTAEKVCLLGRSLLWDVWDLQVPFREGLIDYSVVKESYLVMMQRFARMGVGKLVARRAFSDAAAAPTAMKLNFCTPHAAVYSNKEVSKVTLPGELGEFGVTVGHSPIISQLRPGVVSIEHTGVSVYCLCWYFLPFVNSVQLRANSIRVD